MFALGLGVLGLFFLLLRGFFQVAPPDWTQFTAVLIWLAGPVGAVFAVNWLIGNFLEKMAWWANMPKWVKWTVPPVVAILVALGAQQLIQIPGLAELIQPYWALAISIILAYFGSQLAHIQTRKPKNTG